MKRRVPVAGKIVLSIAVVLGVYLVAEVTYRLYLHHKLEINAAQHLRYGFSSTEAPLYTVDEKTGYAYLPSLRLYLRLYDVQGQFVRENHIVTNNYGHLEAESDSLDKPTSEFRIAVIGDSFSATIPSNVPWPTALQAELNHDAALKKVTGKTTFKVINFGLDGTGLVQWPSVYEEKVIPFHPDLVIVSFISNDLYRQFIYRQTIHISDADQVMITCTALPADINNSHCLNAYSFVIDPKQPDYQKETTRIKRELYDEMVARLPWFSPYPELLAAMLDLNGRLGLRRRLQFQDGSMSYFRSTSEALASSRKAAESIASKQPAVMFLYHPTVEECLAKRPAPVTEEMIRQEPGLHIENMLQYLPISSDADEIKKWYNLPYDSHPSDYGAQVYAHAVEGRMLDYLYRTNLVAARHQAQTASSARVVH
jgi:hypothetical protein